MHATHTADASRRSPRTRPDRHEKFLRAVLDDALHVYQRYATERAPGGRRLFDETAAWFASDDRRWAFSFLRVCEELGVDPAVVRAMLERWTAGGHQVALLD